MTLKDKLIANEKIGGRRRIETINYDMLTITILTGHLSDFIESTGISKGLLSMYLNCSQSCIDEMINGFIPRAEWLAQANSNTKAAIKKIDKRIDKKIDKEKG